MIKKSVVSLLAVAAISTGGTSVFASTNVTQTQTGQASVNQNQTSVSSGPINLLQNQYKNKHITNVDLGHLGIAAQGQTGSVTGVQVQSAKTSGSAVLTQSLAAKLNLIGEQTANTSQQNMKTAADNSLNQSTATAEPSQVVQAQMAHTAAIQFEGSIPGGPVIQYQQVQRTSIQYQNAVKSVSP